MSTLSIGLALAIRIALVLLFLPFSALDKVLDFRGAVAQAQEAVSNKMAATALILVGLFVEVFMSAGVVSGVADRACAFVLAGYCAVTALVWKQFWRPGDFWSSSTGMARALFWDFWKNLALVMVFITVAETGVNRIGAPMIGLRQTQFLQILALTGQAARGRRCTCPRSVSVSLWRSG